jgi:hypothetical protein
MVRGTLGTLVARKDSGMASMWILTFMASDGTMFEMTSHELHNTCLYDKHGNSRLVADVPREKKDAKKEECW